MTFLSALAKIRPTLFISRLQQQSGPGFAGLVNSPACTEWMVARSRSLAMTPLFEWLHHKNCSCDWAESSRSRHAALGSSSVWSLHRTHTYVTFITLSGSPSITVPLASLTHRICWDWKDKGCQFLIKNSVIEVPGFSGLRFIVLHGFKAPLCGDGQKCAKSREYWVPFP